MRETVNTEQCTFDTVESLEALRSSIHQLYGTMNDSTCIESSEVKAPMFKSIRDTWLAVDK